MEEECNSFPLAPGAFLAMSSPALEFAKMLCHLLSLDPLLGEETLRLRRNLLKLLGTAEFSDEARFVNPCRTFVLPDAVCAYCHDCRDLDVCRAASSSREWLCTMCHHPHDPEAVESRLVQVAQQRALEFLTQVRSLNIYRERESYRDIDVYRYVCVCIYIYMYQSIYISSCLYTYRDINIVISFCLRHLLSSEYWTIPRSNSVSMLASAAAIT